MESCIFKINNWKLKELNSNDEIIANVPGDITNDLYLAGKIENPYFGFNHNDCYDLCKKDYIYTAKFDIPSSTDFVNNNVFILFKGIDIFSEIHLNGILLGKTDNMFKEFKFDISSCVKEKDNILEVKMQSTINVMQSIDCKDYFGVFNVPRVLLRKKQCDFGWDWAANIPGYGIWKEVLVSIESKENIEDTRYIAGMDKKAIFIADLNYC